MKNYFSKPYVLYLALLAFGLNLSFNFQLTYLSSIFKFFGAQSDQLSFLWLAPAVTGLLVQPIIGQLSDAITTRDRRRPYMIGSGVLAVLSFLLIPYANNLLYAVLLIWVLNGSVNGCIGMWRALTTDLSPPNERSKTFAYHAFVGAIGTAIGISLPYVLGKVMGRAHLEKVKLPINLHWAFIISGVVLGLMLLISMAKVKELSQENASDKVDKKERKKIFFFKISIRIFLELAKNLKESPFEFKKLCLLTGITSLGVFIFWIYFILALAQNFYALPVGFAEEGMSLQTAALLEKATVVGSGYLSISQVANIIYSLLLFVLLVHTKKEKLIYGVSLFVGGVGLFLIGFAHTPTMLVIAMIGSGILIGSFSILPFIIASHIFPKEKIGAYFGLFNMSITFAQVVGGFTLSPAYRYIFGGNAPYMMFLAGALILISAVLWLREAHLSYL